MIYRFSIQFTWMLSNVTWSHRRLVPFTDAITYLMRVDNDARDRMIGTGKKRSTLLLPSDYLRRWEHDQILLDWTRPISTHTHTGGMQTERRAYRKTTPERFSMCPLPALDSSITGIIIIIIISVVVSVAAAVVVIIFVPFVLTPPSTPPRTLYDISSGFNTLTDITVYNTCNGRVNKI